MNRLTILFAAGLLTSAVIADDETLIFEDNFNRDESQQVSDEVGEGWSSNSTKETKGKSRQFDLKDGALHVFRYEGTKHSASIKRLTNFKNGVFEMKFKMQHEEDLFELTFIDPAYKDSKNGQLFEIEVSHSQLAIREQKTGGELRKAAKKGQATPEQVAEIKKLDQTFPIQLEADKWHSLRVGIADDTISISVDDQEIGTWSSTGIAHPVKGRFRLAFARNAIIDDLKVYSTSE